MFLVVGEIAVLGVAGAFAAKGAIPVGDVVVYQMLFLTAMQSVQGIVSLLPETAALREGVDSLNEIFAHAPPRRGGIRIDAVESLDFRNVTFAYPGAYAKPVVKDFSATFRVGNAVALVGALAMGLFLLIRERKNAAWIDSFSIAGSMLIAMASAIAFAKLM